MANDNNYFEFLDIPDGNGSTERWYTKDAEARAAIAQLDPASVIEVSDVTALTSQQIESLLIGSRVNKSDSTGKHGYTVTYRSDTGMCLTYADAENVETVSYDKVEGTWTYNSTDITPISRCSQVPNKADKVSGNVNNHVAGLNSNGNLKSTPLTVDATTGELITPNAITIQNGEKKFQFNPVIDGEPSDINIDMGWNYEDRDGSGAAFRANDESLGTNAGSFHLWARDDEDTSVLVGYPDGRLNWNSNKVYTAGDFASIQTCQDIISELT